MAKTIAINGFGRIGRSFLRTILQDPQAQKELNVAVINIGPGCADTVPLLFKYDTLMGTFPADVSLSNSTLTIGKHKIKIIAECEPANIPWSDFGIDWVVEATGCFITKETASPHLQAGAKKVLITAPAKDEDITIIPGVNDAAYSPDNHHIVSLGSCTTNCFAPMVAVLRDQLSFTHGLMTTIHAYTNDQVLLDVEHRDPRRARAAALNIIPTKTGAEKVITKMYPDLVGKLYASAIRVPVGKVSLVDLTFTADTDITVDAINAAFKDAATNKMQGILHYETQPLVSCDFGNTPYSCAIDSLLTKACGKLGKVFGWYDNEWGYSQRLTDFLLHN